MKLLRCSAIVVLGLLVLPVAGVVQATPVSGVLLAEAKPQAQKAPGAIEKKRLVRPAARGKAVEKRPAVAKRATAKATKSASRKKADAIAAPLPKAKLDLRLPPDMVDQAKPVEHIKPVEQIEAEIGKPLLPSMFGEKPRNDSPFQLNGRLLSNEMQLQLRNDSRQDVEGAAIDFEFKQ